uniref:Ribosomal RNA-processing protein 8 n=1 Tax=Leptobrachium leishanense TaxID=445787 RepID=A0A8C5MMG8_9ANUR
MFDLCDWNDDPESRSLSESLVRKKLNVPVSRREAGESGTSRKKRLKRTRKLLDVLHTLEAPRDQEDLVPTKPSGSPAVKRPRNQQSPEPGAPGASEPASETLSQHLNRQQWKNRMKNKRRNKNKFSPWGGAASPVSEGPLEGAEGPLEGAEPQSRGKRKRPTLRESEPAQGEEPKCLNPHVKLAATSVKDKRKLQKLRRILQESGRRAEPPSEASHPETKEQREEHRAACEEDRSTTLRSRMEQRLNSARFRYINQQLYTSHSKEARRLFRSDPEAFTIYHSGFSQQVQRWPVNPITEITKYIKNRPASLVVADFGCGDALLARSVRNKVHSFDLLALNEHVTVCDIAKVPLLDESVDIAVFCLSLMGTNFTEFLREANRVLRMGGVLLVAEVSSRFEDVRPFLSAMAQLGFKNVAKSTESSHFFLFEFSKSGSPGSRATHPGLALKPCLYKKR